MQKYIRNLLGIDQSEEGRVYTLLLISFFLGVFVVTYDVTLSTLFLDKLKDIHAYESIMIARNRTFIEILFFRYPLPIAIALTGVLGIIGTFTFTLLQRFISFASLSIFNLILLVATVSVITFAFQKITLDNSDPEVYYLLVFFAFSLLGPMNAVSLLGFYGTISRAFTIKQEKRIMGMVDQGALVATSIAFFLVLSFSTIEVKLYLYASAFSAFIALLIQLYFIKKYRTDALTKVIKINKEKISYLDKNAGSLIHNKYLRLLSFMFFLSVVSFLFMEYSFLTTSSEVFPEEKDLTAFLSTYGGVLTLISFIMQVFIGDKIIENYGVRISLLVLPVLVSLTSVLAGLLGWLKGTTEIMFFVFLALGKLFLSVSKDAFEDPILKNFFLPLDVNIRHDVQAKVEGIFKQFSWAFAGVAIFLFGFITIGHLEYYSFILLAICIGYAYVTIRLYTAYQNTLVNSLNTQKLKVASAKKEYSPINVMKKELNSPEPEKVIFTLKLMEKIEPVVLQDSTNELVYDPNPQIRKYAIQKISEYKTYKLSGTIKNALKLEDSEEVKQIAEQAIKQLEEAETIALSEQKLYKLTRSLDPSERELAAKLIYQTINDTNYQLLIDLMRDPDERVRKAAFISAGKSGRPELWPLLFENLSSPKFGNIVAASIFAIGEKILPSLESTFYKSGQTTEVMVKIVQLYGRFGTPEAIEYLWNKIDFPDNNVTSQVLLALSNSNVRAEGYNATRIIQAIEREIGNSAWLIAAYTEVGDDPDAKYLRNAILEEIIALDNKIFMLLALIYDPNSIQLVRQNIESRTSEGVLYAIELLNVFIADELKPVLFPLLDEISIQEKIERLQKHYLRDKFDQEEILIEIINRDYNFVNRWTKACAIQRYANMIGVKVVDDLVANLFNHDKLLRETSAYAIYKLDKKAYEKYSKRLHTDVRKELDEVIYSQNNKATRKHLMIEKIFILKEVKAFINIPGLFLAGVADNIKEVRLSRGDYLVHKGDKGTTPLFVVVEGELDVLDGANQIQKLTKGDLIGEELVLETDINPYDIICAEDSLVYIIEKEHFYEMMSKSYEMTEGVIAGIVEHKTTKIKHDIFVDELEDITK